MKKYLIIVLHVVKYSHRVEVLYIQIFVYKPQGKTRIPLQGTLFTLLAYARYTI